jgi:hypothetical protein
MNATKDELKSAPEFKYRGDDGQRELRLQVGGTGRKRLVPSRCLNGSTADERRRHVRPD